MKVIIASYFLILIIVTGCGFIKSIDRSPTYDTTEIVEYVYLDFDMINIESINNKAVDFSALSYSSNIIFNSDGSETRLNGIFRIRSDSLIWVSLRMLGFEGARIMMSKDSVWFIDRVNRQYYKGDHQFFQHQFNVDFDYDMLESLLLGNPLMNWSGEPMIIDTGSVGYVSFIFPERYKINQGIDGRMKPEGSTVTNQEIKVSLKSGRIVHNRISIPSQGRTIIANYDMFMDFEDITIPSNVELYVEFIGGQAKIKMNNRSYRTDESVSFPLDIPSGYKPLEIKQ